MTRLEMDLIKERGELKDKIKWFNQVLSGHSKKLIKENEELRELATKAIHHYNNCDLYSAKYFYKTSCELGDALANITGESK